MELPNIADEFVRGRSLATFLATRDRIVVGRTADRSDRIVITWRLKAVTRSECLVPTDRPTGIDS